MSTGRHPRVGELVRVTRYTHDPANCLARIDGEVVTKTLYRGVRLSGEVLGASYLSLMYGKTDYDDFYVVTAKDLTDEEIAAVATYALLGKRDG